MALYFLPNFRVEFIVAIFSVIMYEVFKHVHYGAPRVCGVRSSSFSSVVNLVLVLSFRMQFYTLHSKGSLRNLPCKTFSMILALLLAFCLHTRIFQQSTFLFSPVLDSNYQ